MNGDLGFLAWVAFLAACVIFILIAIGTVSLATNPGIAYWGFALVAFGLAFSGWWDGRRRTPGP